MVVSGADGSCYHHHCTLRTSLGPHQQHISIQWSWTSQRSFTAGSVAAAVTSHGSTCLDCSFSCGVTHQIPSDYPVPFSMIMAHGVDWLRLRDRLRLACCVLFNCINSSACSVLICLWSAVQGLSDFPSFFINTCRSQVWLILWCWTLPSPLIFHSPPSGLFGSLSLWFCLPEWHTMFMNILGEGSAEAETVLTVSHSASSARIRRDHQGICQHLFGS